MSATPSQRVPLGGVLTPRMERLIRIGSIGSAVVIAVSAMVLSYSGLLDLALDAEISPRLALLVPIMVDGLQFVGSLGVVYSTLSGLRSWYPWLLMLMGVSVSAWGNWQAAPDVLTAKLLHAAAPVILALVLEELLRVMRHKVQLHALRHEAAEQAALEAAEAEAAERDLATMAAEQPAVEQAVPEPVTVEEAAPVAVEPIEVAVDPMPTLPLRTVTVQAPIAYEPVEAAAEPVVTPEPIAAAQATQMEPTAPAVEPSARVAAVAAPAQPVEPVATIHPPVDVEAAKSQVQVEGEDVLPPFRADVTFKEQVRDILSADPEIPAARIARLMGKDASHTRKTVRLVKAELDESASRPTSAAPAVQPSTAQVPATQSPAPSTERAPRGAGEPADDLTGADPFAVGLPAMAGRN